MSVEQRYAQNQSNQDCIQIQVTAGHRVGCRGLVTVPVAQLAAVGVALPLGEDCLCRGSKSVELCRGRMPDAEMQDG